MNRSLVSLLLSVKAWAVLMLVGLIMLAGGVVRVQNAADRDRRAEQSRTEAMALLQRLAERRPQASAGQGAAAMADMGFAKRLEIALANAQVDTTRLQSVTPRQLNTGYVSHRLVFDRIPLKAAVQVLSALCAQANPDGSVTGMGYVAALTLRAPNRSATDDAGRELWRVEADVISTEKANR